MAVTVAYNAYDSTTSVYPVVVLQNIYNWINARPETFTIVASSAIGSSSGWFVFKMVGHPWEMWMGANANSTTPTWNATNAKSSLSATSRVYTCFAPGGGWASGTDTPATSGLMFSNAPANSGHSGKISYCLSESSNARYGVTFIYDTAVGFMHILFSVGSLSTWRYAVSVVPLISNMDAVADPYPWGLLQGQAEFYAGTSYYWINYSPYTNVALGSGDNSTILKPTATTMQDGGAASAAFVIDGTNQPNPVGSYDWMPLPIRNIMVGESHVRGFIDPRALRQVGANLGDRAFLGTKAWIVVNYNSSSSYRVAVPWDGTTSL